MQVAVVVALLAVPAAWADGDPASDVPPAADVFLPYPAPSPAVSGPLEKLVASANTGGNRLKVAVIARRTDLGSVPVLFGKPAAYARFLVNPSAVYTAAWRRPHNAPPKLRFCVRATDARGNRSSRACAVLSVSR